MYTVSFYTLISLAAAQFVSASPNSYCHEIDSVIFSYTWERTRAKYFRYGYAGGSLHLKFANEKLISWPTNQGDMVQRGIVTSAGCRAVFSSKDTCSVGYWDQSTNCFLTGISIPKNASIIISNFGNQGDYAFVFYQHANSDPIRQIVVYRPGVGAIYGRNISPMTGWFTTREEVRLDSVNKNSITSYPAEDPDFWNVKESVNKIEVWLSSLKFERPTKQPIRIDWQQIPKK